MSRKVLDISPRIPGQRASSEDDWKRIEAEIAAKGEGVAGRSAPVVPQTHETIALQSHDPTLSQKHAPTTPLTEYDCFDGYKLTAPQTHSATTPQTHGKGTRASPRVRRDGLAMRSTNVHLPVDLAKRLTLYCANSERRQSEVVSDALEAYLARNP